ncbi:meiosis 1 arrest protein [Eleutherodactylus coqui]|uniref:meiosis 1 arrest protein n=1 Tax=Eleutherodactylus coqui TaxID=57060 RepID=UPI003461CF03
MCSGRVAENIYPRVLVVDISPPGWAALKSILCEALGNVLCLGAAAAQPGDRLSVYSVRERHRCLLPLLEVRGNLFRLQRCLCELQALPMEGAAGLRNGALSLAVLDSLQQNKQRMQHGSLGAALHGCFVEVTVVSTRPGRELIGDLDGGLKEADLSTLRRLLLLHVSWELEENGSPETPPDRGSHVCDFDTRIISPNVQSLEIFFKSWLLERNSEKEKCHLLLPEGASDLRVMCDVSRPLLDPGLLHADQTHRRESALTANSGVIEAYKVIRAVSSSGVCGSMLYGLPTLLTPITCWELDWDQLEANQDHFHALCHCLQSQQLSLVACSAQHGSSCTPPILSHVLVSASDSAALLLRPLAVRELILLMKVPSLPLTIAENALHRVQDALRSLDAEVLYNPLEITSNLYRHLQITHIHNPRSLVSPGPSRQVNYPSRKARAAIAPLHFTSPGLSKDRRIVNNSPSSKKRRLPDKED